MELSTEQKVKLTVRPLTAGGNPARIDGPVNFSSADEAVVRIEAIDDLTCYAIAVGPGTARVLANFDADLDADELRLKEYDAEITVIEAEADGAALDFAEPEFLTLTPVGEDEVVEPAAESETEVSTEADAEVPAAEGDTDTSEAPAP